MQKYDKRPDKTTGRKRPRVGDVDVVAAPDADPTVMTTIYEPDPDVEPWNVEPNKYVGSYSSRHVSSSP